MKRHCTNKNRNNLTRFLKTAKPNLKPLNGKRILLPINETTNFSENDNQLNNFKENEQSNTNDLVIENEIVSSQLQHSISKFPSIDSLIGPNTENRNLDENSEQYSVKEKSFKYPSMQDITNNIVKNDQTSYCTTSEPTVFKNETCENDVNNENNISSSAVSHGYHMRSSIKTNSGVTRKKWVTFNDIIQSNKTNFVDELYDSEESKDDESENKNIDGRSESIYELNSKNISHIESTDYLHNVNQDGRSQNQIETPLEYEDKLKMMIQQVRSLK